MLVWIFYISMVYIFISTMSGHQFFGGWTAHSGICATVMHQDCVPTRWTSIRRWLADLLHQFPLYWITSSSRTPWPLRAQSRFQWIKRWTVLGYQKGLYSVDPWFIIEISFVWLLRVFFLRCYSLQFSFSEDCWTLPALGCIRLGPHCREGAQKSNIFWIYLNIQLV